MVDGSHLVGIITETDFFIKGVAESQLPTHVDFLTKLGFSAQNRGIGMEENCEVLKGNAEDIMTVECITLSPESDVKEFLKIIREKRIHTAPVAVGDILVGVITVADIIKLI